MIGEVPFRPRSTDKFAFDWLNFEPPRGLFYVRVVGVDEDYNVFYRMSQTALSAVLPGLLYYIIIWLSWSTVERRILIGSVSIRIDSSQINFSELL